MRLHPRTMPVQRAKLRVHEALDALQRELGLTDVEMMQIITDYQQQVLRYWLREERHPDDPERKADEE